jgi:hypothetical protein
MYISNLGQAQTMQTTTQVVYRQPMMIAPPAYYAPGVQFGRRLETGVPSQMYPSQFNSEDVEKAVYKDLPKEVEAEKAVTGNEPQNLIKLKSGLEIPSYILQRDIARKQAVTQEAANIANIPPPRYHKIGVFATNQPAKASLIALALGYICGQIVYNLQH